MDLGILNGIEFTDIYGQYNIDSGSS